MSLHLEDNFGRRFAYMRLSVTDACNFRCVYCLPSGYQKPEAQENALSVEEIRNLATAFAEMGLWKIRVTGGEPTLRKDLFSILETLNTIPQIKKIALSTNAYRLHHLAPTLRNHNVSAINVSIDTLDRRKFEEITGADKLPEILSGIERALSLNFSSIKINAVLMKGWNDKELYSFLEWVKFRPVTVRFIELMPTATNSALFKTRHAKSDFIRQTLTELGWCTRARMPGDGPAEEFTHPEFQGSIGIIAPYSSDFCTQCNRLRVTSQGQLRLCLFADGNFSLREWLKSPSQKEELKNKVKELLKVKEISHYLPEGKYGDNQTFSAMGG